MHWVRTSVRASIVIGVGASFVLAASVADARPEAPGLFCETYPESPHCFSGLADCAVCHTIPPVRNPFGDRLAAQWDSPVEPAVFAARLPGALEALEPEDTDGDGASNRDEIDAGTFPGDPRSAPAAATDEPDPVVAFRKLTLDACGFSPEVDETEAIVDAADPWAEVDRQLEACLASEYWKGRDGVLWRIAHPKIRPLAAIKSGADAGDIPLADYEDDYNLFAYASSGDRDVRDLLLARYLVERDDGPPTTYTRVERNPLEDVGERGLSVAQLVDTNRRAGLLTTRWNLASNTMFTAVPRTTAAQAYRAYLGYDISKLEGLFPVEGEPVDYDAKDVQRDACAVCHSTLDPLTYPFAHYNGIGGGNPGAIPYRNEPGRPARFTDTDGPNVADVPEGGVLFGTPVADLLDWARVAADSEAFARATVMDYWRVFVGREPSGDELAEIDALVTALRTEHRYRVEAMLHDLVRTRAYAAP
jgi:hypothetical protein